MWPIAHPHDSLLSGKATLRILLSFLRSFDRRQSIRESMTLVVVDTRTLVLNRGYLVRVDCFSRRSGNIDSHMNYEDWTVSKPEYSETEYGGKHE